MLTRRSILLVAGLSLALAATVAVEESRIGSARADNAQLALNASNITAAQDSTREITATNRQLRTELGDSVRVFQKRVVQIQQRADASDRAVEAERRGRYAFIMYADSLLRTQSGSGVTEDSTTRIRRASFDVRQAPYTVTAAVELPPAPDTARLELRVALDPIPVVARLSCAPPNEHGIRSASIEAQTPAWAHVRFDDVQQSPDLCASPALAGSGRRWIRFAPVVIGAGRIVLPDGTSRWGGFVGSGFALGGS